MTVNAFNDEAAIPARQRLGTGIERQPRGPNRARQGLGMGVFWRLVVPVFGLMGARLAGAAFGFLSQILLARSFPRTDVGVAFLAMSIATFVSLLVTCGYHTLALTYLARYQALARPTLVEAFLAVSRRDMIIAGTLILAVVVLGYYFAPVPFPIAKAAVVGTVTALPLAVIRLNNSAANAQRRFTLSYAPDFVVRSGLLLAFIVGLLALHVERHIDAVLLALVIIAFLVAVWQAVVLGPDNAWNKLWAKAPRDLSRYFRHRAVSILLVTVAAGASADLTVMLGGVFLPTSDIAVLGVAARLAALVGFFSAASQPFILRDLAQAMTRSSTVDINRTMLRMNIAGLSIMAGAIVVCAIGGPFILGIYGKGYAAGYWPLLLFMVGQLFRTSGGLNSELLALGGHQVRSAMLCACAVATLVVLSALLAPRFGMMGLAMASVGAEAFWAVGLAYLTQKLEGRRGDLIGLLMARR